MSRNTLGLSKLNFCDFQNRNMLMPTPHRYSECSQFLKLLSLVVAYFLISILLSILGKLREHHWTMLHLLKCGKSVVGVLRVVEWILKAPLGLPHWFFEARTAPHHNPRCHAAFVIQIQLHALDFFTHSLKAQHGQGLKKAPGFSPYLRL